MRRVSLRARVACTPLSHWDFILTATFIGLFRARRGVALALTLPLLGCEGGHSATSVLTSAPKSISAFTVSSDEEAVIPPGTQLGSDIPDEHLSFLRQADGTFRMWVTGTARTYGLATPDLVSLTSLATSNGMPTGVLLPSSPGSTAFDADYAGAGSVFPAANGSDLLMIYHAENHLFNGVLSPGQPFYAGIGLARSSDGGVTWTREGQIIAAHDPQSQAQASGGAGASTPSAIEAGGYIYVVYREIDPQSAISGFAIARAPISSDGAPGRWLKYSVGAFNTPGLGGAFTPLNISLDPTAPGDMRQPQLSFNAYLGQFLMTCVGNGGIYALTSADLISWTPGMVILPAPVPDATVNTRTMPFNWYPTIVSTAGPSDQTSGQTGYLYYAKGSGAGNEHYMYRRSFKIVAR